MWTCSLVPPQASAPRCSPGAAYVIQHRLGLWHFSQSFLHLDVTLEPRFKGWLLTVGCRRYLIAHPGADEVQVFLHSVHVRLQLFVLLYEFFEGRYDFVADLEFARAELVVMVRRTIYLELGEPGDRPGNQLPRERENRLYPNSLELVLVARDLDLDIRLNAVAAVHSAASIGSLLFRMVELELLLVASLQVVIIKRAVRVIPLDKP